VKVIVTGGAGYIGSHTCVELLEAGHEVLVIDNLSNGHKAVFDRIQNITNCEIGFINADIRNTNVLEEVFNSFKPDSVIHFAGLKAVEESVAKPLDYYEVNVGGTISLLGVMSRVECNNIIFSSSATVYGDPQYLPYDEMHPTNPINPYGRTKLIVENIINDWVQAHTCRRGTILRYFNPVGAHESGQIGEEPNGVPNNLMPYIAQVAVGRRETLNIFGNDYDTSDGTGERDYIHVVDLANAHMKALHAQSIIKPFEILNIGCGLGITVLELIKAFEKISGVSIKYQFASRRKGDLPKFWADTTYASNLIDWNPKFGIEKMCQDTWRWQKSNLNGY